MSGEARFLGFFEYEPTHWRAEFSVHGSSKLPEHAQVSLDTLAALQIPVERPIPTYYEWTRDRYQRRLQIHLLLKELCGR